MGNQSRQIISTRSRVDHMASDLALVSLRVRVRLRVRMRVRVRVRVYVLWDVHVPEIYKEKTFKVSFTPTEGVFIKNDIFFMRF